jgi:hypothetical protein
MEKLNLIHGAIQNLGDLGEVQAQIDKATEQLKSSTDALDSAVKANKQKQQ